MLKIRDNVDLKELEKYGFKFLYDEETGQPKELVKKYFGWFYEERTIIRNEYDLYHWQDTLYDLIKDGLVEKVE